MSIQASAWALKTVAPSHNAKCVLICMANFATSDHVTYAPVKSIALEMQMAVTDVCKALEDLVDAGLVTGIGTRVGIPAYRLNMHTRPAGTIPNAPQP